MPSQAAMRFLLAFRIKAFIKIYKSLASIAVPRPSIHRATISINCSRKQSTPSGPAVTILSQSLSHLLKCFWKARGNQPYGNITDFMQSCQVTSQKLISSCSIVPCIEPLCLPVVHVTTLTHPSCTGQAFSTRRKNNADCDFYEALDLKGADLIGGVSERLSWQHFSGLQ